SGGRALSRSDATAILRYGRADDGRRTGDARSVLAAREARVRGAGAGAGRPALRAESQARDLPAHGRRTEPDRLVGLQARAAAALRPGLARFDPTGPALDDDVERAGALPGRALDLQVQPVREQPGWSVDQRAD